MKRIAKFPRLLSISANHFIVRSRGTTGITMNYADPTRYERIWVTFEKRPDGGLRVSSPDVPGFRLSHSDPALVTADIIPALETIIGELIGRLVRVRMASRLSLPDQASSQTSAQYETKIAA